MLRTISLVLPIVVPSWRFFQSVEPSPRVQWALVSDPEATVGKWQPFRPRPAYVSPWQMFGRLFWNPAWNETLFMVSCAERIQEEPTAHSIHEIRDRILRDITEGADGSTPQWLQFRLVFVALEAWRLTEDVVFVSDMFPVSGG